MHINEAPHSWLVSPKDAISIQRQLAAKVIVTPLPTMVRWVAGLDCAFFAKGQKCLAGVVVWDLIERKVIEQRLAIKPVTFPYIPGLLSFRELPALIEALRLLDSSPDLLICDGHGQAHPRRLGIASHLGIIVQLPTIGCAKSRLVGSYEEPGTERGAKSLLQHQGDTIGVVVRTKRQVKPVFVSIGHKIDLATASAMILSCGDKYRLPEPTRLADRLVANAKKDLQ